MADQKKKKEAVDFVAGYPRVTPDLFDNSYLLKAIGEGVDEDHNTPKTSPIIEDSITIEETGQAPLPGNPDEQAPKVPVYTISFQTEDGQSHVLENRYAFIGYGSNSSPEVLAKKFGPQNFGANKDVQTPVLMVNVKDHAIVHSAFIGGAGSIPVTMMREEGVHCRVSMSFYTKDQVQRMNSTEPNYDVFRLDETEFTLNNGAKVPARPGIYDSIWGALLSPQGMMMANDCIPHQGRNIQFIMTKGAMKQAHDIFAKAYTSLSNAFNVYGGFEYLKNNFEDFILTARNPRASEGLSSKAMALEKERRLAFRMKINAALMERSKPRNLKGVCIQPASLTEGREKILEAKKQKKPRRNPSKPGDRPK